MDFESRLEDLRRKKLRGDVGREFEVVLVDQLRREFPGLGVHRPDDAKRRTIQVGGKPISPDAIITRAQGDDWTDPANWLMMIEASSRNAADCQKPWDDGRKYAAGRAELQARGVPVVFISLFPVARESIKDAGETVIQISLDKGAPIRIQDIRWSFAAFLGPVDDPAAWIWISRETGTTDLLFRGWGKDQGSSGVILTAETLRQSGYSGFSDAMIHAMAALLNTTSTFTPGCFGSLRESESTTAPTTSAIASVRVCKSEDPPHCVHWRKDGEP